MQRLRGSGVLIVRTVALGFLTLAALSYAGWLFHLATRDEAACVAGGLALYVLSTFPAPPPPPSR